MEDEGTSGSPSCWNFRKVFAGWVPTVLGALSFRSIGQATFPSRAKYANIPVLADDGGSESAPQLRRRVILAFQSRNASDDFFSSLRNFFGRKKECYFVLRAHTDPARVLDQKDCMEKFMFLPKRSSGKQTPRLECSA